MKLLKLGDKNSFYQNIVRGKFLNSLERIFPRSGLLVGILLVIIFGLLLLTIMNYRQLKQSLEIEQIDTMALRTKESADHINTWLTGRLGEVRETAQSPILDRVLALNPNLDLRRQDESIRLIDELNLARWRYVSSVYPDQYTALLIVNNLRPNEWSNPANLTKLMARYYNIREGRSKTGHWPNTSAEEAGQRYSLTNDPYDAIFRPTFSADDRNTVLMLAWRRDKQGKVLAGAAASITIETIQGIAQQLKYGKQGYAMLLAKDGTFVTPPNPYWATGQNMNTVNDANMQKLGELATSGESGVFRFVQDQNKKIAFYSPVPVAQWTVVSVVDEDELFVPAHKLLLITIMAIIVLLTFLLASVIVYIIRLRQRYADDQRNYLAQVAAAQAQIQPHFLYNTLNTIAALCRINPHKAVRVFDDLGDYLQGKFRLTSKEMITLKQELDLIDKYLMIEQVRFGDRLKIIYSIEESCLNLLIPPLILQPLVENAVNHGVFPKQKGGTVQINVTKRDKNIYIIIADDGVGMTSEKVENLLAEKPIDAKIGVHTCNRRLQKYFGQKLIIQSKLNCGTTIIIIIPGERGQYDNQSGFN